MNTQTQNNYVRITQRIDPGTQDTLWHVRQQDDYLNPYPK